MLPSLEVCFFAGRLFFPDTPADHVCKLYAVFIAGIDFPEKTQILLDEHQPDTDLSAQLLLCYSLSGSDRLVCSWNAPVRKMSEDADICCFRVLPALSCRLNGNDAASSDIHDDSGA